MVVVRGGVVVRVCVKVVSVHQINALFKLYIQSMETRRCSLFRVRDAALLQRCSLGTLRCYSTLRP